MEKFIGLGRYFFALAMIASGVQELIRGDFVRLVPKLPDWVPGHAAWVYGSAFVLIATGIALLVQYRQRLAGFVLAAMILLSVVCLHIPVIATNPKAGYMWTNPLKAVALVGGALLLAAIPKGSVMATVPSNLLLIRLAAFSLGLFLLYCGVQHYVYLDFVIQLVPAWIPARPFWACLAGAALIAGGLGVMLPPVARWAGLMSGIMILLWVLLLHIPRAVTMPQEPGETSAVFEALAFTGICLLVAATAAVRVRKA